MILLSLYLTASLVSSWPTIDCGRNFVLQIRPWCTNGLRVRMAFGDAVLDNLPGALSTNNFCGQEIQPSFAGTNDLNTSTITNGAITAKWDTSGLNFLRDDGALLFSTLDSLTNSFSISPSSSPLPPTPSPFACQDSCTLGKTGIREHTDATQCSREGLTRSKLMNVTRSACCSACASDIKCKAWAWGRDSADPAHRHNCYLCSGVESTIPRSDRDFGCVERPSVKKANQTIRYYSIGAAFTTGDDEFLTGLGQHSYVGKPCLDGRRCGQWKLNQKGFTWPLRITKYQIMIPLLVSSRQYAFLWNAPGDGQVALADTNRSSDGNRWNSSMQRQIDFWVTAAPSNSSDPFTDLLRQYADATGHAPVLPAFATGFWQSRMRYRSTDELLDVAAGYESRGVPLSVLVIDFYSWTKFGDFQFDERCW